jgi:hypothetical protein
MAKKNMRGIAIASVTAVALAATGFYLWQRQVAPEEQPAKNNVQEDLKQTPAPPSEPEIHYPIGDTKRQEPAAKPLPPLDESDSRLDEELGLLFGQGQFEKLLAPHDLIRRIVVTVDNLGERRLPALFSPLQPLEGTFTAIHDGDNRSFSTDNFARYAAAVALIEQIDMAKLVKVYTRFYPLFQSAYADLGMTGYFNDRLVAEIERLLKTPTPNPPVQLLGEDPYYTFADPKLESLAAGQKILLRLGPANEKIVKTKLSELHDRLLNTN